MGTPEFAVPSLEILHHHHYPILAVVTAPDKPRGRGQAVLPTAVKRFAVSSGLTILQPVSMKDPTFVQTLERLRPDLIVVVAFRILPQELFSIARLGAFNLHASLLPKYRGAAPINRAVMNGETETGVTTFMLQAKVDTGGILLQEKIGIQPDDDAGVLHDRLASVGARVVLQTVRYIEQGTVVPVAQDDSRATSAPKIQKEDCRIRWDQHAVGIHNMVRGLSPYPGAFTIHNGSILKLYRTSVLDIPLKGMPGEVFVSTTGLRVATSDRMVSIIEVQQEGKRRMGVEEFLRGYQISTGDMLTG